MFIFFSLFSLIFSLSFGHTVPKGVIDMEPDWLSGPMPFELGVALVENPKALEKYAALERIDKQHFISEAAAYTTRTQLQGFVQSFAAR